MFRTIFYFCLLLGLVPAQIAAAASSPTAPPSAVLAAARLGLPDLLAAIPTASLAQFGFETQDEFARCEPVRGLPVRFVVPDEVFAAAAGRTPDFGETVHWLFPVSCDGRYRALLTVAFHRGRWAAVDLGAAALAADLETVLTPGSYPAPAIVRVPQAGAVFLQPDRNDASTLIPIGGTDILLGLRTRPAIPDHSPVAAVDALTRLSPSVVVNLATATER